MEVSRVLARQGHWLLVIGMVLLVYSSLDGFVIPYLGSPRIGLSVHTLSAYQGVLLLTQGFLWTRLRLGVTASRAKSDFNRDFGVTTDRGETFGLSVFLRDGKRVYRSYFTTKRGVEALGSTWTFLDLTPLGRQETWEHSPKGWPQTPPYEWWRRHDEYGG